MTRLRLTVLAIAVLSITTAMLYLWLVSSAPRNHHPVIQGPAGSVRWELLAKAKAFGFTKDLQHIPRTYPEAVKELAGKEIHIKGYMITLQPKESSRGSCWCRFHLHALIAYRQVPIRSYRCCNQEIQFLISQNPYWLVVCLN